MSNEPNIEFVPTIARGRMYDPVMSSFLSVDNYVQSPDFSQSFNRYSYCWNNPLKYTDPSGELVGIDDIIIGAAIGIMFNTTMQALAGNINSASDLHTAMFVGALSGAAGAWAGGKAAELFGTFGAAGGGLTGASGSAAGGFVGNACDAWCHGATFGQGFTAGLIGAGMGIAIGGTIGALSGGFSAKWNGGDFWTGKGTVLGCQKNPSVISDKDVAKAKQNAVKYKYSNDAARNDAKLQKRIKGMFEIKKSSHVGSFSTKASTGFGMTDNLDFVQLSDMAVCDGYVVKADVFNRWDVHISPSITLNPSDVLFKAVAGHELTHVYHHAVFGSDFDEIYSESACYDYTINVLTDGGCIEEVLDYIKLADKYGYTKTIPSYYSPYY